MSSSAAPANKRQRASSSAVVAAANDNDDDDLLKLLNGHDEFVSPEQRQEDEAVQRRAARRKRLRQQAQQPQQPGDDGDGTVPLLSKKPEAKEDGGNNTKMTMDMDDNKQEAAASTGADFITKGAAGGPDNNGVKKSVAEDDGHYYDKNDDDEFDMFSSSVSPPPAAPAIVTTALTTTTSSSDAQEVLATNKKPTSSSQQQQHQQRGHEHQQDWDDAEGYYKAVIGETIALQIQTTTTTTSSSTDTASSAAATIMFRVLGVVGKGVFSTVLKCTTISNSSSYVLPPTVALKCIRHNESMTKAAQAEIRCLQQLNGCPGVVPLLLPQHDNHQNTTTASSGGGATNNNSNAIQYLEHCGHLILVFPFMEYNLRDVLQKFGKGVGLSLQAVRSYAGQLLAAATHLKKHCLLHLDLKPDNILVSADFSTVQLADFGSVWMNAGTADPNSSSRTSNMTTTPYLVSRFYRAPEIILGLTPLTFAVDLWSLAVTVAEVFLGRVLFHGHSNNDMLYVFMQHLGPFSNRVIRQHLVSCQKHGSQVVARYFQQEATNYVFLQQTVDAVTGEAVHKVLSLQQQQQSQNGKSKNKFPLATPLRQKLLQAKSAKDSRALVIQFADLLQKALALDPTRRISLKEALQHEFFQD
jgi:serine/threonine-protein kinase PRP4